MLTDNPLGFKLSIYSNIFNILNKFFKQHNWSCITLKIYL